MLQTGREFDLTQKAVRSKHRGQLRMQHLDRDAALVTHIDCEVHRCHPAFADFTFDRVTIGKRGRQTFKDTHARTAPQCTAALVDVIRTVGKKQRTREPTRVVVKTHSACGIRLGQQNDLTGVP